MAEVIPGPIPAQAGEPPINSGRPACSRAYPRAGGGTPLLSWSGRKAPGPIPAQAGEPSGAASTPAASPAYPRAGGGTAPAIVVNPVHSGLSPRRRGNQRLHRVRSRCTGPIPAQAGEPYDVPIEGGNTGAYPRAGGGTVSLSETRNPAAGLSPRRRGNPPRGRARRDAHGPIPAQAGEPLPADGGEARQGAYPRAGGGTPCY